MGELDGRVAVVTGGALGLGRGVALAFVREGAAVVVADANAAAAQALVSEITDTGGAALAVVGDVSDAEEVAHMIDLTDQAFGKLDVLVNNAGIQPLDSFARVEDLPINVWDRIVAVNLTGVFLMSKFAIPLMRRGGRGVVINIASVQGLQSMPRVSAYGASKGGVLSLTRAMALDYAGEGIRVVAICPGTMDSDMVRALARAEKGDCEANLERYGLQHPLERLGQPEDIAAAAVFLASDRASFITGEYLCVDGGLMARGAWATSAGSREITI